MNPWHQGYVTEVDYTYGFYRELTPALMQLSLLAGAVEPPPLGEFKYCELGFGQGVGLNVLAAANPRGEFWGTDFNPAHAAGARQLAAMAGLQNFRCFDDSFEEFAARTDLPKFDWIVLHGVYSWVGERNRAAIVEFLRKHLAVGGVVHVSYNALPGWAPLMPLRELLVRAATSETRSPMPARIESALALAKQLNELPIGYFKQNAGAVRQLEEMAKQDRNYLAHEYLNAAWDPLYFADVAAEMETAKLTYAGSADVSQRFEGVTLPAEVRKLLSTVSDPVWKETLRDFSINQRFRRDLFVRGGRGIAQQEQLRRLREIRVALTRPRAQCPLKVQFGVVQTELQPSTYEPVLDALAARPLCVNELVGMPALADIDAPRLVQALLVLVGAGYAMPCLPEDARGGATDSARRFNRAVCAQARATSGGVSTLAAPSIGSGLQIGRIERLFADALFQGAANEPAACAQHVWRILSAEGQALVKGGKRLETAEENVAELTDRARDWLANKPTLEALGVL